MKIVRPWRFASLLTLVLSVAIFAPLSGCSSDDEDSDTAQTDEQNAEDEDPGRDINITEVVLPEFTSVEADVKDEQRPYEQHYGEDGPLWKRTTIRTFTNFDPAHPERGGWEFNGPYEEYYGDLTIKCTGTFADGKMTGEWVWYGEDGVKSKEATYENGVVSGTVTFYRPGTDHVLRIESYAGGQKHGRWATYAEDGETLLSEATFENGAPEGIVAEWYPSGSKKMEAYFVEGKLHGTRTTWFDAEPGEEPQIATIENYTQGKPNGRFAQYSASGTQLLELEYVDGERVQESAG